MQHALPSRTRHKEIWSATPTPFHADGALDARSVQRLVEHHIALGVDGIMLAGTCGEGQWMPREEIEALVQQVCEANQGRLEVAVQVTDNSSRQMLRHIERAAAAGAQTAVIAAPYFFLNATPERLAAHYRETIRQSALPVGFYERGRHGAYSLPLPLLEELLYEPNIHIIKDSSADPERQTVFLDVAAKRPELRLFAGDEFLLASYLEAGYHGGLLGGGIFNAHLQAAIGEALAAGANEEAGRLQLAMNDLMWRVYGGKSIKCWLTGLKSLLVSLGIFETNTGFLGYPLTEECRLAIDDIARKGEIPCPSSIVVHTE